MNFYTPEKLIIKLKS